MFTRMVQALIQALIEQQTSMFIVLLTCLSYVSIILEFIRI